MKKASLFLYVSGILLICLVVVGWIMYHQRAIVKEGFETPVANALLERVEDPLPTFTPPQQANSLQTRPCALYYTNNIDLCNDNINNWYTRSIQDLKSARDRLIATPNRSYTQDATLSKIKTVIAERESGTLPNGVCKVEFPGWVEFNVTPTGEPFPYKNEANFANQNRLMPEDWAYCFKSAPTAEQAVAEAKAFADEYVVKSFDDAGEYFRDGKVYGKIAFTTIHLDDSIGTTGVAPTGSRPTSINSFICSTPPVNVPGVPSSLVAFDMLNDTIRKFYVLTFNNTTKRFDIVTKLTDALKPLFSTVVYQNALYLVPIDINGVINQFAFDVCGRVNQRLSTTNKFTMSLRNQMNIQPKLIMTFAPSLSNLTGTVEEMKARVTQIDTQIVNVTSTIQRLRATLSTSPSFTRGYIRYTYKLKDNLTNVSMDNTNDLNIIFDGMNGIGPFVELKERVVMQTPPEDRTLEFDPSKTKYGYVFEGYINIGSMPSGLYEFRIISDDAGDFFINRYDTDINVEELRIVASHYGQHTMTQTAVPYYASLTSNKYYRFRARMVQWQGQGSGIKLEMRARDKPQWNVLNPSLLSFDVNDTKRYEISVHQKTIDTLNSNKALLEDTLIKVEQNIQQYVDTTIQAIEGQKMPSDYLAYVSMDGRLYVDVGALISAPSQVSMTPYVILQQEQMIVTRGMREMPSPVTSYSGTVQYSISMWIYIAAPSIANMINIFYHGTPGTLQEDLTPGIWLDKTFRVIMRQRINPSGSEGCDTANSLPVGRWVHYVAAVNGSTQVVNGQPPRSIQLYVDGAQLPAGTNNTNFKQLDTNMIWHWGDQSNKKAFFGYNSPVISGDSGVYVQKVHWYNRVIGRQEVEEIYKTSGIMRNKRVECRDIPTEWKDAYGMKTNIISNHDVSCPPGEGLTALRMEIGPNDTARMNYRCCKVISDDPITYEVKQGKTATSIYNDGNASALYSHPVSCDTGVLQSYNLFTNTDLKIMNYDYECADATSTMNLNRKCVPKTTQNIPMDSTMRPFNNVQLQCDNMQQISRIQLKAQGTNQARYEYDCCEIGGLS